MRVLEEVVKRSTRLSQINASLSVRNSRLSHINIILQSERVVILPEQLPGHLGSVVCIPVMVSFTLLTRSSPVWRIDRHHPHLQVNLPGQSLHSLLFRLLVAAHKICLVFIHSDGLAVAGQCGELIFVLAFGCSLLGCKLAPVLGLVHVCQ